MRASPQRADYRQELARTRYNRGILHSATAVPLQPEFRAAESDFREAIRLLEPLAGNHPIASLRWSWRGPTTTSATCWRWTISGSTRRKDSMKPAIRHDEVLTKAEPANREYTLELAKYCNNLSDLLRRLGDGERGEGAQPTGARSARRAGDAGAVARHRTSRRPQPARAAAAVAGSAPGAVAEYRESLDVFERLRQDPNARHSALFHQRYQDLLFHLAAFAQEREAPDVHALLVRAVADYLELAQVSLASGLDADAKIVLDSLATLLPDLSDKDRRPTADALPGPPGSTEHPEIASVWPSQIVTDRPRGGVTLSADESEGP